MGTNAKASTHDAWVLKPYTVILCHIWCQEIAFCFGNFNVGNSKKKKKAHETAFSPGLSTFSTRYPEPGNRWSYNKKQGGTITERNSSKCIQRFTILCSYMYIKCIVSWCRNTLCSPSVYLDEKATEGSTAANAPLMNKKVIVQAC